MPSRPLDFEVSIPEVVRSHRIVHDFSQFPSWNYPTLYDIYCVNYTIPGEKNYIIGTLYTFQYLLYLILYVPALIVISRPPLIDHACYKLMFVIGILDNTMGFFWTFMGGVFSFMGANYCDHNLLLIVVGHIAHGLWACYCMTCVFLALNRYIELRSLRLGKMLFAGRRLWCWLIPPVLYGLLFSSTWDIPIIYNSMWSVYLFQIDFRPHALPVTNWICVSNSFVVMFALILLYSLLFIELKKRRRIFGCNTIRAAKDRSGIIHKKAIFQSFLICFVVFIVVFSYALAGFVHVPHHLAKFVTIAIQMLSGFTSIVYLVFNKTIRIGVKKLLFGRRIVHTITPKHAIITPAAPPLYY